MTLSDLAKYSMSRSIAQSLCESWVFCLKHLVLTKFLHLPVKTKWHFLHLTV